MRIKSTSKAQEVVLQFGRMTVEPDASSVLVADPLVDESVDIAVVMIPHENVSITPHKQSSEIFLITTSDTAAATVDYLIASTR